MTQKAADLSSSCTEAVCLDRSRVLQGRTTDCSPFFNGMSMKMLFSGDVLVPMQPELCCLLFAAILVKQLNSEKFEAREREVGDLAARENSD